MTPGRIRAAKAVVYQGALLNFRGNLRRTACWPTIWFAALLLPLAAFADDLIERFATIETVWAARIAPDGKHVALGCSTQQGLRAACVYELDALATAFNELVQGLIKNITEQIEEHTIPN